MIVRPQASTLDFGYVSILRKYVSSFFRICYVDTCEETTLTFTEVSFWTSRFSSFSAASLVDNEIKNSRRIKKNLTPAVHVNRDLLISSFQSHKERLREL